MNWYIMNVQCKKIFLCMCSSILSSRDKWISLKHKMENLLWRLTFVKERFLLGESRGRFMSFEGWPICINVILIFHGTKLTWIRILLENLELIRIKNFLRYYFRANVYYLKYVKLCRINIYNKSKSSAIRAFYWK